MSTSISLREAGHVVAPQAHAPVLDFTGGSLRDRWQMAEMLSQSQLVPKEFRGKPGDILIVADLAASLGMSVAQGLQSIACINGKPTMWGDGLKGVVYRSPLCEWIREEEIASCAHCKLKVFRDEQKGWLHRGSCVAMCAKGKTIIEPDMNSEDYGYRCTAKRANDPYPVSNEFTVADARRANLFNKDGPWKQYGARRMCRMRARSWTLRDLFPDVLKGLAMREEIIDVPSEVRDAVLNAPTRTDALKNALSISATLAAATPAPPSPDATAIAPASASAEDLETRIAAALAAASAADPDFAKMKGLEIKSYVAEQAEMAGLKPWDLAEVVKGTPEAKLVRSNVASVLWMIRERALRADGGISVTKTAAPKSTAGDAGDVEDDGEILLDDDAPHGAMTVVEPASPAPAEPTPSVEEPDLAAMSAEQLYEYVTDAAFGAQISEPALKVILRAHAENGLTSLNVEKILAEIAKRAERSAAK